MGGSGEHPGNVFAPATASGRLDPDSVVNVTQVSTIDRDGSIIEAGSVPTDLLDAVERGVRLDLGLA
jgi:mRNA-degrading endonuclease toxin of MazEF toxin-antitoxin module